MLRTTLATLLALFSTAVLRADHTPVPEMDVLKKYVGSWETSAKHKGGETKGMATYTLDLDGHWLMSKVESEFEGKKYKGHGMDSFDTNKKKYVSVWVDNMTTNANMLEGDFDAKAKTMTLAGMGPNKDGKTVKQRSVTEWQDDDHFTFRMYEGDAKEPLVTVAYARKK